MNEVEYKQLKNEISSNENPRYKIVNERILYLLNGRWLNIISHDEKDTILFMLHDHPTSGHFGIEITYNRVKEKYYWPNMKKDIEKYIKSCEICQKRSKKLGKAPIFPIEVTKPFETWGIDFVGPLKETPSGNKYILVTMDYFTKWPEAKALKEATGKNVAQFLYKEIICRYGQPKKIISDRGSHFNNEIIKELCRKFEMKHSKTSSYHPQTNGLVERFNQTLCETLAKISETEDDWDNHIEEALYAYRTRIQSTTDKTPYYLTYGKIPNQIINETDIEENNLLYNREDEISQLNHVRNQATEQIKNKQIKMKVIADKRRKNRNEFQIGEKVLLKDTSLDKQWSGKLKPKWKGPYLIYQNIGKGAYKLRNIDTGKILRNPQNVEHLRPYNERIE